MWLLKSSIGFYHIFHPILWISVHMYRLANEVY